MIFGMWPSLVGHFVRDEGAAGSNPVIPTKALGILPSAFLFFTILLNIIPLHYKNIMILLKIRYFVFLGGV